jgi:hypothetical protein
MEVHLGGSRLESRLGHRLSWFFSDLQANSGIVSQLGHDTFIPNPLQHHMSVNVTSHATQAPHRQRR